MKDPLKTLQRELWKRAQEDEPYRELEEEDITDVIHSNQGYDPRTVEKWWRLLRNKGVIKQVPRLDRYKVDEPEDVEIKTEGEIERIYLRVDKGLRDAAEGLGIDVSTVLNEALADKVASQREYVSQLLGQEVSEEEANYILELVQKELYKKETRPEQEAKLDDQRRSIYKHVFGVEEISEDEYNHLDNLRIEAWDVAEALGLQSPA